ncbi:MAG: trypsin-like peptidase domain-containing protein [Nitrososphaerota archaeon]|jgi:S1-C subfamily serine protease|nr:trypsin-like peptidase domain-containing protein [Nitrososphaerota archaeon]MDG6912313.1 trypsin-like peptidase domain-containing protein [Nitrososphaerota archaeon]MDG6937648.1 trypsin-like peptidase domain-containing protein [Nitrososphaerota archaeon]MDG6962026.1 trypsin-like peptidase domain-containing protein [Nitrososphaerota archaeon]MDG6969863.1 trypsin-like peptidase domain-containing protein [Nitrososphaerota archaeon]
MEVEAPRPKWRLTAVLIAALLAVSFVAYYEATSTHGQVQQQVSSLQAEVTSLQAANQALQSRLAAAPAQSNQSYSGAEGLYANLSASVVTIQGYALVTQSSFFGQVSSLESVQGSGFVVEYQGAPYVVTNNHVVSGVTNITATFSDGNSYTAQVQGTDPYRDLAVLQVNAPASEFHPMDVLGTPQAVSVGEQVYAIGSPLGLSGSMTEGIVSQIGRTITESTTQATIPDVIQFSAAINPGNSGGPLLNSAGEVIGITTAAVTNSQGLGFAIPASTIARELPSLVTTGNYTLHPYLGISASADMTYQLAQATGSNVTYGVLVESVVAGGPAAQAGLRGGTRTVTVEGQTYQIGGDVIVAVNGTKVISTDALSAWLEVHALPGQTVQLGIIRAGSPSTISVKVGTLP